MVIKDNCQVVPVLIKETAVVSILPD